MYNFAQGRVSQSNFELEKSNRMSQSCLNKTIGKCRSFKCRLNSS